MWGHTLAGILARPWARRVPEPCVKIDLRLESPPSGRTRHPRQHAGHLADRAGKTIALSAVTGESLGDTTRMPRPACWPIAMSYYLCELASLLNSIASDPP